MHIQKYILACTSRVETFGFMTPFGNLISMLITNRSLYMCFWIILSVGYKPFFGLVSSHNCINVSYIVSECEDSKYGSECKDSCGYCINPPCNKVDGVCIGGCQIGYDYKRDATCKTSRTLIFNVCKLFVLMHKGNVFLLNFK